MFYTGKILSLLDFTREKHVNRYIFGKKMWMRDVLLVYFEQIVTFCAEMQTNFNYFV